MRGTELFVIAFLLGLSTSSCAVSKHRVELGPLYYKRYVPGTDQREEAILWPFFQRTIAPAVREYKLLPLCTLRREWSQESVTNTELKALWPLMLYRKNGDECRAKFFPVVHYTRYRHPDGNWDTDWGILPFVLGGRAEQEGSYFSLFPLGGLVKGLLGKDRIWFALFPLFAHARDGDYRSWHILWPFLQYGYGGGRGSYRIWPLWGRTWKKDVYQREFMLWPFVVHMRERQGLEHPTESWFFLPFYGHQQTPYGEIYYWAFPLFSYQRNERPGNRFREWTLLYPLVRVAHGDRLHTFHVVPFWGRSSSGHTESVFALYPLYWFQVDEKEDIIERRRWILPLYWSKEQIPREGHLRRAMSIKVWPLLDYERNEQISRIGCFSPLWFRDPDGFERQYGPFWRWYEQIYNRQTDSFSCRLLWWYQGDRVDYGLEDAEGNTLSPEFTAPVDAMFQPFTRVPRPSISDAIRKGP